MNLNLVENQFGSFTMGVNLKKVNINLEFVSERFPNTPRHQECQDYLLLVPSMVFIVILPLFTDM